ncbi:hypothetical protein AB0A05_38990, partial [Streptomyces sp. NPDC046374]
MDTMSVERLADLGEMLTDHHTEALIEVIDAKAEHRAPAPVAGEEAPASPVARPHGRARSLRRQGQGDPACQRRSGHPARDTEACEEDRGQEDHAREEDRVEEEDGAAAPQIRLSTAAR